MKKKYWGIKTEYARSGIPTNLTGWLIGPIVLALLSCIFIFENFWIKLAAIMLVAIIKLVAYDKTRIVKKGAIGRLNSIKWKWFFSKTNSSFRKKISYSDLKK